MDIYDDFILSIMKKEIDLIFKLFKDVIEYWFCCWFDFYWRGYSFPFGEGVVFFSFFFFFFFLYEFKKCTGFENIVR